MDCAFLKDFFQLFKKKISERIVKTRIDMGVEQSATED